MIKKRLKHFYLESLDLSRYFGRHLVENLMIISVFSSDKLFI